MRPGERLKQTRQRLGITTRRVERESRRIAEAEGNKSFYISNARLTKIENLESTPSIYKLYSLSVIYRAKFTDLLLLYGVDLDRISKHQFGIPLPKTHLVSISFYDPERAVKFPVRFHEGFDPKKTDLLSHMVELWGEVPVALLQHLDPQHHTYGYVGLEDYTLYPLVRPGTFVQIDEHQNTVKTSGWRSEFDRPIYFVGLGDDYACSWCDLIGESLTLVPHPASPCYVRKFHYPSEAKILGRVTALAMHIVSNPNGTRTRGTESSSTF